MSDTVYRETIIATAAATRAEITANDIEDRISRLRVVNSECLRLRSAGLFARTKALMTPGDN